jgi:hypothetical protein
MHKPDARVLNVVDCHVVDSTFTVTLWHYWSDPGESFIVSVARYLRMLIQLKISV